MRALLIVALVSVGCAVGTKEESLFPEDVTSSDTKSAPVEPPVEAEQDSLSAWHHWHTIDVPAVADGLLELNIAETPARPIEAAHIAVFDADKRPIGTGYKGWYTASVVAGERLFVDVIADPAKGEVKLLQSFKPVIDDFEPNDDIAHATTLVPGKPSQVHLFATHEKKIDIDYFRVVTKGKRSVRLHFENGSRSTVYCADVIADGDVPVGGTCSSDDLDAAFLLPEHSGTLFVKLSGPSSGDTGSLTVSADY